MAQITGVGTASVVFPVAASAGLEAQLARLQKELSECVNCDSAKTSDGKVKIQTVFDKISGIKAQLETIAVKSLQDDATSKTGKADGAEQANRTQSVVENKPVADSGVGSVINIKV